MELKRCPKCTQPTEWPGMLCQEHTNLANFVTWWHEGSNQQTARRRDIRK